MTVDSSVEKKLSLGWLWASPKHRWLMTRMVLVMAEVRASLIPVCDWRFWRAVATVNASVGLIWSRSKLL